MPLPNEQDALAVHFRRHAYLARQGALQDEVFRLEEGWACRAQMLSDGRRQITELFLPGDYCEPQWLLNPRVEQSLVALTSITAVRFSLATGADRQLLENETVKSLLGATVVILNRQARHIVSLGCRSATERTCDYLLEIFERMARIGRVKHNRCALPLTQLDLADALGLTTVHVNRVLQRLRGDGLLELQDRQLHIPDPARLGQRN